MNIHDLTTLTTNLQNSNHLPLDIRDSLSGFNKELDNKKRKYHVVVEENEYDSGADPEGDEIVNQCLQRSISSSSNSGVSGSSKIAHYEKNQIIVFDGRRYQISSLPILYLTDEHNWHEIINMNISITVLNTKHYFTLFDLQTKTYDLYIVKYHSKKVEYLIFKIQDEEFAKKIEDSLTGGDTINNKTKKEKEELAIKYDNIYPNTTSIRLIYPVIYFNYVVTKRRSEVLKKAKKKITNDEAANKIYNSPILDIFKSISTTKLKHMKVDELYTDLYVNLLQPYEQLLSSVGQSSADPNENYTILDTKLQQLEKMGYNQSPTFIFDLLSRLYTITTQQPNLTIKRYIEVEKNTTDRIINKHKGPLLKAISQPSS